MILFTVKETKREVTENNSNKSKKNINKNKNST